MGILDSKDIHNQKGPPLSAKVWLKNIGKFVFFFFYHSCKLTAYDKFVLFGLHMKKNEVVDNLYKSGEKFTIKEKSLLNAHIPA